MWQSNPKDSVQLQIWQSNPKDTRDQEAKSLSISMPPNLKDQPQKV
jgi:hypothetical protein